MLTENQNLPETFQMQHILKNKKSVLAVAWLSTALVIVVGGLVRGREDLAHSMTNAIAYCVIIGAISLIYISKLGARKKIFAGTLFIIGCLGALNLLAGTSYSAYPSYLMLPLGSSFLDSSLQS